MKLHLFNPENDLALADGGFSYCPPPAAVRIANELASLPLWYAGGDDVVHLPHAHIVYRNEMAKMFALPTPYNPSMQGKVTSLSPWGWSAQMRHRFKAMGFDKKLLPADSEIEKMRNLSSRVLTIEILTALRDAGIHTPPMPRYICSLDEAVAFVNGCDRCVVKAPWSGSGKGIMWGIGRAEEPMVHFCKGVIRRQGGVMCEHFLNGKVEFAMEFFTNGNAVSFAGYSLFKSFKGSYSGNILASDSDIELFLAKYIPLDELLRVKSALPDVLSSLLCGSGYEGYFGIDMMIYESNGTMRLNPCMELNLRMNMGMVSRIFFDRYVAAGCKGEFRVNFFKKPGEALAAHLADSTAFPLEFTDGKIKAGYLSLSPVTESSHYSVSVILYKNKEIEEMY